VNDETIRFQQFLRDREQASLDYVRGHAAPVLALAACEHDASFFPPTGGGVHGTQAVRERYEKDAAAFDERTESSSFDIFHCAADQSIAYWTGLQYANVRMKGVDELMPMKLRVTEVFRKEQGSWRLVLRHADALSEAQQRKPG
jgi:ketosteroid isomerase-like protein